jgi:hypothetical protein
MNIAKGIQGIRTFLKTTAKNSGWHIFADGEYRRFDQGNALAIIRAMSNQGYTLTSITGNGLTFTK